MIGSSLCNSYNINQRRRFFDEIIRFTEASEAEQRSRLRGNILTLEEYWSLRLGTSAVYISSAMSEFSMLSCLPPHIMNCQPMQDLWNETNIIISTTNDLLSLKKETMFGSIDNIVPIIFASTNDIDQSISEAVVTLCASKERFDKAARALLIVVAEDEFKEQATKFIEIQRSNCVGNLVWRYDFVSPADNH